MLLFRTNCPHTPPPPLVQATVNDQKLRKPTPSVAWTSVLFTRRNLRDARVHLMYYSENQDSKHAANGLLTNRAALTPNMNFLLLNTNVSRSTHGTQQNELKNAPPKSTVQKLMEPTPGVAWTWALLGHRTVESSAIGPHRQTYALNQQVSRGGAATHIVRGVQQGAVRRHHTLSHRSRKAPLAPPPVSLWSGTCL